MTPFDQVATWTPEGDHFVGTITEDWMQGRASFGGLLAAGCTRLAMDAMPDRPLRSIEARFFEPAGEGQIQARVEVLRAGRSVAHVQVEVWQGDRRCMRAVLCFAGTRESDLIVHAPPAPDVGDGPDAVIALPYFPGLMPAFTQNVDMRFLKGIPFSGQKVAELDGWCRMQDGATGLPSLVGLLDAWPSPVMSMGTGPMPASTVHWSSHLFPAALHADPTAWFRTQSRALHSSGGTCTFESWMWDLEGRCISYSEQLMVVFDRR